MALTIPCDNRRTCSIEEYVDYISGVDLRNEHRVIDSAAALRALANDRSIVIARINQEIEKSFEESYLPSAQTIFLGGGPDFYVRAAVWPSSAAVAGGRLYQDKFAYHAAHDHNFTFLTVNYLGPGYETEIYEYDYEEVEGYIGEPVDLQFIEKVRFTHRNVMLYRAGRDVHIQYPPEELSVTLNLMISLPEIRNRDQFYFDTVRKAILDYVPDTDAAKSVSLMKMAALLGNVETAGLLAELATKHSCRRARFQAFEALAAHQPKRMAEVWEMACRDRAPLVANAARRRLKGVPN